MHILSSEFSMVIFNGEIANFLVGKEGVQFQEDSEMKFYEKILQKSLPLSKQH